MVLASKLTSPPCTHKYNSRGFQFVNHINCQLYIAAEMSDDSDLVRGCQIALLILVIVGVAGNTLSFVVLCGKSLRFRSTSVYLQALAVADILVLLMCVFR